MLFFHGTRGDRSLIEAIRRDGLRALRHEWTHSQLGHEASTFLANAPVAGAGGDPVAFAMGYGRWKGPRSHGDGWIIVVDLPRERWGVIRAVVPNLELAQYFDGGTLRQWLPSVVETLDATGTALSRARRGPMLIELLDELGRRPDLGRIARSLRPVLVSKYSDLHADDFSFGRWRRYAGALLEAASVEQVLRAGRRWGFRWEKPEVPHCALCVAGMATWVYAVDAPLACAEGSTAALYASMSGRDLLGDGLESLARTVARGYAAVPREAVALAFARLRQRQDVRVGWAEVLAGTPLDADALPPSWSPDFGRRWAEIDVRAADVQVVCDAIAPEHVVGALRLSSGARLRAWARPRRGETLAAKLWHAAAVVRARHRGSMVLYDG